MLAPYSPFYNQTLRRYIVSFGNLFNQISIQKYEKTGNKVLGNPVKTIKVPLAYSKKERYITRLTEHATIEGTETDTKVQMTLPRIGFDFLGISYDSDRKLSSLNTQKMINPLDTTNSTAITRPSGVPFNYDFELYVMAKELDEIYQIVEQILPYFGPQFNMTIKDNANYDTSVDIPLIFGGVTNEDRYEGEMDDGERRTLIWTLSFSMKGYLYGPTGAQGGALPLIKQVEGNVLDLNCNPLEHVIVRVDPFNAGPDDDYGIVVQVFEDD